MNKLRTILSLALVALMSVPAYGAEAMQVEQPQGMVAKSKQAVSNAKKRALKQFDESVDRFKRCIRGKCTKMEALKVARDVTIAAAATIAAMYVTGVAMEKGGKAAFDKVRNIYGIRGDNFGQLSPGQKAGALALLLPLKAAEDLGSGLQVPGQAIIDTAKMPMTAINLRYNFPIGSEATYYDSGKKFKVIGYDYQTGEVILDFGNGLHISPEYLTPQQIHRDFPIGTKLFWTATGVNAVVSGYNHKQGLLKIRIGDKDFFVKPEEFARDIPN